MTHEELKECIGEYRELKKDLWWVNCWGVQKVDGYNFGVHYNDFAGHWQFSWNDPENEHRVADIEDIFDNRENCEEYAEFGNITRTDTLKMPTWNEFSKWDKSVKFFSNGTKYSMYVFVKNKNTNNCRIIIYADNGEQDWIVFEQPLTKENYDNARRICVNLFRGESV